MCSFCNVQDETIVHLFWYCNYTKVFWNSFCKFVIDFVYSQFSLFWKDILFGFVDIDKNIEKEFYLINLLLLLANTISTSVNSPIISRILRCLLESCKNIFKRFQYQKILRQGKH